jgi:hypothetical protein
MNDWGGVGVVWLPARSEPSSKKPYIDNPRPCAGKFLPHIIQVQLELDFFNRFCRLIDLLEAISILALENEPNMRIGLLEQILAVQITYEVDHYQSPVLIFLPVVTHSQPGELR